MIKAVRNLEAWRASPSGPESAKQYLLLNHTEKNKDIPGGLWEELRALSSEGGSPLELPAAADGAPAPPPASQGLCDAPPGKGQSGASTPASQGPCVTPQKRSASGASTPSERPLSTPSSGEKASAGEAPSTVKVKREGGSDGCGRPGLKRAKLE